MSSCCNKAHMRHNGTEENMETISHPDVVNKEHWDECKQSAIYRAKNGKKLKMYISFYKDKQAYQLVHTELH